MAKHNNYKRKIYLQNTPREQAKKELLDKYEPDRLTEYVKSADSLGRVTAEPIFARFSMPHFHAAAMDGIAVKAEATFSAHESNPVQLNRSEDFVFVDTGNPVPSPYNAVIMIENVEEIDEETVEIIEPAAPWQHIRPIGEDIVQEEMLFPQGHAVRPADIGALLASGAIEIPVIKKPLVTIIPTGNELVQPELAPVPEKLIEFNGMVFANFIREWGGEPLIEKIVKDDPSLIRTALLTAVASSDIVVINAGSSAGSRDYTVHIIGELGTVYTHGVATRPGKPVILGEINGTIVVGVPGYPVSAYLALEWFVRPLICKHLHIHEPERPKLLVTLGRRIVSTMGAEDFIRMNIGYVNGKYIANPLTRAAGVTMSFVRADGILVVPPNQLGYEQGESVEVELFKPVSEIAGAIVFNGSHDLTIDLLSAAVKKHNPHMKIVSSHVGSMAGLVAIKKGEAHIAGTHLLDPETKQYNLPYIKRFLPGHELVLYPFLKRKQGWLLPPGNPLSIQTINDIIEKKADYVNRQNGAGTRVLFDLLLNDAGFSPEQVNGYDREMFSHLSVAAEVKNNLNAAGLGIYPAAKAMGLDFVPLSDESYDLLMTREFFESEQGRWLISIIKSKEFEEQVNRIGGYSLQVDAKPIII
ncbi:molybdopterin biosynthesis protein [Bacillus sp. V33-4]|uniref:molybdopterin biosynthesis protein n=1 Tax=Bacillus sp. V33-4 TaxID=2054169 RepID=UPI000C76B033|nr:molybdopterin biosynthesis protein [Bacillus sp. V33-4]PLR85531.1 molybdopterin biosynthesis protein [Bacillus sp. V33-4]